MQVFVGRVAVCTVKAAYGCQTFPVTIDCSVCLCVCPVHYGEMGDRIVMPFGMVCWTVHG